MSECPSCGRFTGPYPACPYCGARLQGRTPLRWLKIAAVILSVVGLAGLWFAATRVQIPLVRIDRVGEMMNMAYVRIEGRVSRGPSYNPQSRTLSFWVVDASGSELMVSAFRSSVERMVQSRHIPAVEDRVSVAGTLRIRDDFSALSLNAPDQLVITRTAPTDAAIADIGTLQVGQRFRVRGQVRQVRVPYAGLTLLTLRDSSGEVVVSLGEALTLTGELPPLAVGTSLEVAGAVSIYGTTPQLVPALASDVVALPTPVVLGEPRPIGSLEAGDEGRWVQVEGAIVERRPFSGGLRLTVEDTSGRATLLLWDSVHALVPYSATLEVGARVRAQGAVSYYRGELEVVPEIPGDVAVLVTRRPPEDVMIGRITAQDVGQWVHVRGQVRQVYSPYDGLTLITLRDSTGAIPVAVDRTPAELADLLPGLAPGQGLEVEAVVSIYRGTPQLAALPAGLLVVPSPEVTAERRATGALSAADVGRWVRVEGAVVARQDLSGHVKLTVDDGSGPLALFLYASLYAQLPASATLDVGARVQAQGQVTEYQGELELEPEVPADVVIVIGAPAPQEVAIAALSAADAGRVVIVRGVLGTVEPIGDQGVRYPLDDGSGTIALVLWNNVLADAPAGLAPGVRVQVTGTIEEYRGTLEIVARRGSDVTVIGP